MSLYKNSLKDTNKLQKDIKIGFISWEFNKEFVLSLEEITQKLLNENWFNNIKKIRVPWALEIPAMLDRLLDKEHYDLVYCFWVVIRWETSHYEVVTRESTRWIMDLSLKYKNTWIIMWILTCENQDQVKERINNSLAISWLNLLVQINKINIW